MIPPKVSSHRVRSLSQTRVTWFSATPRLVLTQENRATKRNAAGVSGGEKVDTSNSERSAWTSSWVSSSSAGASASTSGSRSGSHSEPEDSCEGSYSSQELIFYDFDISTSKSPKEHSKETHALVKGSSESSGYGNVDFGGWIKSWDVLEARRRVDFGGWIKILAGQKMSEFRRP